MQRFQPPNDLAVLSGAELLRLLTERNLPALAVWCPRCSSRQIRDDRREADRSCPRCGALYVCLDDQVWEWISDRIRRAMRQQPMLLATVKAEFRAIRGEEAARPLSFQHLPKALAWLPAMWNRAGRPNGRPFKSAQHFRLYHLIQLLRDFGLRPTAILELLGHHTVSTRQAIQNRHQEEERREIQKVLCAGATCYLRSMQNGLTEEAIRKALHQEWVKRRAQWTDWSDRGEQLYDTLEQAYSHAVDALMTGGMNGLGEQDIVNSLAASCELLKETPMQTTQGPMRDLTRLVQTWFGRVRPEEVWRRCRWVARQRDLPHAQLSGERVKNIEKHKVPDWVSHQRLPRSVSQPTNRDYFHFKMVSVLVRQEGFSQADAVEVLAKQYRGNGSAEMILQSLERVSQYEETVASLAGRERVDPQAYWQPGILKKQLDRLSMITE